MIEIEIMGDIILLDVDYSPPEPETGAPEYFELHNAYFNGNKLPSVALEEIENTYSALIYKAIHTAIRERKVEYE